MSTNATWIWYPGDFEVWLGNKFNNRRTERGALFPPFWKQDSHWPTVVFTQTVRLDSAECVSIWAEGKYNIVIDGQLQPGCPTLCIPAGRHTLAIKVWNQATPPALFISGQHVRTDATWQATYEDKIWIDELGVAHGSGVYVPVGCWHFDDSDTPPSHYRMPGCEQQPETAVAVPGGTLYDFGRETFGTLLFHGLRERLLVCYGESREEALDTAHCETLDTVQPGEPPGSKAFRYVFVRGSGYDGLSARCEQAPFDSSRSGSFRCSDDLLNRIWQVSARTLELTTQEFFMDGIKRDRWVWSGDAIQSYLMNYYLHFDTDCVKRTIRQLRGKDPVTAHINTIMDYTFYWFISIQDYVEYTGDMTFLSEIYPRMTTLMQWVLSRTDSWGMAEGQTDDWIFVDWTDFPMHKRGTLCFEQILLWKALCSMACCAHWLGSEDASRYALLAETLRQKTRELFLDNGLLLHAMEDGHLNRQITRFPHIMAILYDFVRDDEQRMMLDSVLQNPDIDAITTPYMRFYELAALCKTGRQADVLSQMKQYWGAMLQLGATTFWEKYNPQESGTEHLAMYGRPYGKSLCHAWGASPLYIIGRYFLGVRPTQPGYDTYEVRPATDGLEWMQGDVPTPFGLIHVEMSGREVSVRSDGGKGTLVIGDRHISIPIGQTVKATL